jgi:cell division protein FtsB
MDSDTRDSRPFRRNTHLESEELERRRRSRRGKTGWKRPRRILGLWARLALLLGVIVVSVFFAISLVAKALRPYREAGVQSAQLASTRRDSAALVAQNADLARRIRYLQTTDGIASEARSYGYLRPGERPIMVKGLTLPAMPVAPPVAAPPVHSGAVGAAGRFWHHLTGH